MAKLQSKSRLNCHARTSRVSRTYWLAAGLWLGLLGTGAALGQDYPIKSIRIITTSPGGGSDFNAREMARGLGTLGQPVVVDNRAAILVGEAVAKSSPDGYTLMVHGAALWIGTLLQKYNYEMNQFSPVTLISQEVMMLAVHPSVPAKSTKELIALAKAKPDALIYAYGTPGSPPMLGAQLLNSMAGIKMLMVPYKGTGASITSVVAGETHVTVGDLGLIVPQSKAGRLRALAVTSAHKTALAPDMLTVASAGLPGFEVTSVTAMWAPAKTPAVIINRLNQESVRHLNRPDTKERFLANTMEVAASSPEQLAARVNSDLNKWGKLFREAGIKPE